MASKTLRAEFEAICNDYFPRWRDATAWRLKEGPRAKWIDAAGVQRYTSEDGYCDDEGSIKTAVAILYESAPRGFLTHTESSSLRPHRSADRQKALVELGQTYHHDQARVAPRKGEYCCRSLRRMTD